jgi:hypothetical protein
MMVFRSPKIKKPSSSLLGFDLPILIAVLYALIQKKRD